MEFTWKRVFIFSLILLVLCVECVDSYSQSRYNRSASTIQPQLTPNCDRLSQPLCNYTYSTNPKTGEYTIDYYLETCSHQQCVSISPVDPPPHIKLTKANIYVNATSPREIPFPKSPARKRNFPRVPYPSAEEEGRVIHGGNINYWFCTNEPMCIRGLSYHGQDPKPFPQMGKLVGYTARVEAGTGLSPGAKEDQWARCQYQRYANFAELGVDCSLFRFTCIECAQAYRYYLCAMAFPKCQPAVGGLSPTGTDIYGPDSLDPAILKTITYTITKPCRTLCYGVVRFCPNQMQFLCHLKESRDFADWPGCNTAGNYYGGDLHV